MKIAISLIALILLSSSVSAWFPTVYGRGAASVYGEICMQHKEKFLFWERRVNECSVSDIEGLMRCNQKNPLDYSCMNDNQRLCKRNCETFKIGLAYLTYEPEWLGLSKCWCVKDGFPVEVPMETLVEGGST